MAATTRFGLLAAATMAALATTLAPGAPADAQDRQKDNVLDDGAFHVVEENITVPAHKTLMIVLNAVNDEGTPVDVCARGGRCPITMRAESSPVAFLSAGNRPRTTAVSMKAEDWGPGNSTTVTWTYWTQ